MSLRWLVRSTDIKEPPQSCDYCNKPEFSQGKHFKNQSDRNKHIDGTKNKFGCNTGKALVPFQFKDGSQLWKCPVKVKSEAGLLDYIRAYSWLDSNNILPFGGFSDQSEKFVMAMEVIRHELRAMERDSHEESMRKAKSKR